MRQADQGLNWLRVDRADTAGVEYFDLVKVTRAHFFTRPAAKSAGYGMNREQPIAKLWFGSEEIELRDESAIAAYSAWLNYSGRPTAPFPAAKKQEDKG